VYAGLDEKDKVLYWLAKACEEGSVPVQPLLRGEPPARIPFARALALSTFCSSWSQFLKSARGHTSGLTTSRARLD